ncbi:CYTH domain-containing protein [Mucilaginibacter paludis]|uniref:Adenylate cyclase n=1 Tax=Mucilaginibacter paludis DSM 18603 TaxID=714943 RepID=H1Y0Y5_9SPHI|nr:CYTH domain-containing protein [Mucilaginibacter paludis]EHQ29210.1 adenylate cyclase [Mucilaginibacter paludis DSM 18603]
MGVEIERKFLVNHGKWNQLNKPAGTAFRQGYMVKEADKTVRVRVAGNQAYITIKGKSKGISRSEYEYEIPVDDAGELLSAFCEAVIYKTRYCITFAGKLWEIDVFDRDNEGLIMAEIELDDEAETFDLPDWVETEVTGDDRYYNSNLSINPYKNWA